jgi:hypothetical protein
MMPRLKVYTFWIRPFGPTRQERISGPSHARMVFLAKNRRSARWMLAKRLIQHRIIRPGMKLRPVLIPVPPARGWDIPILSDPCRHYAVFY